MQDKRGRLASARIWSMMGGGVGKSLGAVMYAWHAAEHFRVLANERRLRVLCLLAGAGSAGMSLEQVAMRSGLAARSAQRTLDRLAEAGLVKAVVRRKTTIYGAAAAEIEELVGFLTRRLSRRGRCEVAAAKPVAKPYRSLAVKLGKSAGGKAVAGLTEEAPAKQPRALSAERLSEAA
jgi:DNA-binding transcriptional ArsR family regulator